MSEDVLIAIIGVFGVIISAWIGRRIKIRKKEKGEQLQDNVVGQDKISDEVLGIDKIEAQDHIHLVYAEAEKKSTFSYYLEKLFVFVFTFAISSLLFGGIGFVVGQEVGGAIGLVLAFIAAIVNAGSVKRTKSII